MNGSVKPAWRRVTQGETAWAVTAGVVIALVLETTLPDDVVLRPRPVLPTVGVALLVALLVGNGQRFNRYSPWLRAVSLVLIGIVSAANALSAVRLVTHLLHGNEHGDASRLLLTGGTIWVTNVVTFALWYWELDRGGPARRAEAAHPHPDFVFVQMQQPGLGPPDWEPGFVDYLFLSFTNGTAFSPTDVLPLTKKAKLTMLLQSAVSLTTVVLVVARAVNTLR